MRVLPVLRCLLLVSTLVASVSGYSYPDCKNGPLSKVAICDSSASIEERASSFLAQLNITEKISRLYSGFGAPSPAIPRLGIPELQWINDALHGLTGGPNFQYQNGDVDFNSSTSFPSPINFAATFDDALAMGLGHWTGVEARAFTNAGRGGVDLWSPNINPFRDPRWGRGQEVPGEDPYRVGRYAYNYVLGMQRGEDPRYYLAVADCKHYAAYDLGQSRHACINTCTTPVYVLIRLPHSTSIDPSVVFVCIAGVYRELARRAALCVQRQRQPEGAHRVLPTAIRTLHP